MFSRLDESDPGFEKREQYRFQDAAAGPSQATAGCTVTMYLIGENVFQGVERLGANAVN